MLARSFSSAAVLLTLACASTPPAESPESSATSEDAAKPEVGGSSEAAAVTPSITSGELTVGTITDGATLTKVDVTTVGATTVVTISFEGSGAPPSTKASWDGEARRVALEFHGVREVKTAAPIPLVTGEGGTAIGQPKTVGVGLVADIGLYFLGDDSAIRVELGLNAPGRFALEEVAGQRAVQLKIDAAK